MNALGFALWMTALATVGIVAPYLLFRSERSSRKALRTSFAAGLDAARELGLVLESRSTSRLAAAGTCGPYSVAISYETVYVQRTGEEVASELGLLNFWREGVEPIEALRLRVSGGRVPTGMSFTPERDFGDDVLTGDSLFDEVVEARGEPSVVLALLDEGVRRRIRGFIAEGGRIEDGELAYQAPALLLSIDVPSALRKTLELARDLGSVGGGSLRDRLARNARWDPVPGVRLWNLLQLQERFAATAEAVEASRSGLGDTSPWVRLSAARFLRNEAMAVLRDLVRDPAAPDQAAAEAVTLLAGRASVADVGPLLVGALKARRGEARREAIVQLGRLQFRPAVGPLIVLLGTSDARTAAGAAHALGSIGDASAEAALLQAVGAEARELRISAAWALGTLGTVGSVEPLLELLERRRLDAESRHALRECIGAIQSRRVGAGAGHLSIAEDAAEAGRLSLATPSPGAGDLSLAPVAPAEAQSRRDTKM